MNPAENKFANSRNRDDPPVVKKPLFYLAGILAALAFSSCAYTPYDPYYEPSYSVGYGEGYGYGGRSFSTSLFISTGDSRWGYDPGCHSYYDYHRRCYYDPYLYGYYPVGYRPAFVYGTPHPYGWSPGRNTIRPPSRVTNITISNYRDRESSYRSSNYSWSRQVEPRPGTDDRSPHSGLYRPYSQERSSNFDRNPRGSDRSENLNRYPNTQQEKTVRQPNVTRQVNSFTPPVRSQSQAYSESASPSSAVVPQPTQRLPFGGSRYAPSPGAQESNQAQPSRGTPQIPSRSPFGRRKNNDGP
jgi:hypothetical protein